MTKRTTRATASRARKRVFDVRRDTLDFRDKMYVPTLIEVPTERELQRYREHRIPILNQGSEGACTGYGLATVVNYLLTTRKVVSDCNPVSPRMLYELAKRYDEWPGENYSGSSARGAMKGWHKHGVCSETVWPSATAKGNKGQLLTGLNDARTADALRRPLGAYYRVNHKDLVALHAAIAEVGVLFATSNVHQGWAEPSDDGLIEYSDTMLGAHAFAVVGYDKHGVWIQNSWGEEWGNEGFACISYDDWLQNATDVWVARLGAPIELKRSGSTAVAHSASAGQSAAYSYPDLRPHIISLGNNGEFKAGGNYGTSAEEVAELFKNELPKAIDANGYQHILLYAHGGLVGETAAVQRLADYRPTMLSSGIYPFTFIWHTDYWTTVKNILNDAFQRRRPEGVLDAAKDFMLDRLDDALEPLARVLTGKAAWDEMKENALAATQSSKGGARAVAGHIKRLLEKLPKQQVPKIHIVGHSAGSIFHAPLITALNDAGVDVETCTLWAPACTVALFKEHYLPAIKKKRIKRFALFALSDKAEQDDHCANIYHKSLLYLVSHAFEKEPRIPLFRDGEPILGMEKFLRKDAELQALFKGDNADLVISPNNKAVNSIDASTALHHGDFDDDAATVRATLRRILGDGVPKTEAIKFQRSASSLRESRVRADKAAGF
ncbi:C1 family peptidase [Steroidobacter sp.]|uniref:C1 family peptidase n=1 Tax=Steroidobacter sp. TaxID=1978227 RepID=UPI001A555F1C|nr:C1 family peptidase [Steroidobacter sp.]MBL8265774.1 C1 family peptidase [Steroidobacter sp.]